MTLRWAGWPRALRWAAEIGGVVALAVAASLWWLPLGIGVFGAYLIIIGQMDDDESAAAGDDASGDNRPEVTDASTQDG